MQRPAPAIEPPPDSARHSGARRAKACVPPRSLVAGVAAVGLAFALRALLLSAPTFVLHAFVNPAAFLASLVSGSPLLKDPSDGYWTLLVAGATPQKVTHACSGIGAFAMMAALLAWTALQGEGIAKRKLLAPLLLLYPFALLANAARIALSGPLSRATDHIFGPQYHAMSHLGLGTLCFLLALVAFNQLLGHAYRSRSR